jgi:RNA polymerase sigma-32 factor
MQATTAPAQEIKATTLRSSFDFLPSLGSLNSYIGAAHKMPMLEQNEEEALFKQVRENGSERAIAHLAAAHMRLVVSMSRAYRGYGMPEEDLIQAGNIGLMRAIRGFEPQHGARLATYATQWINSEMRNFVVQNCRIVKPAATKAQRKLFFNLRSMKSDFKHKELAENSHTHRETLTAEQVTKVATLLNVDESDVIDMETRLMGGDTPLNGGSFEDDAFDAVGYEYLGSVQDEPTQIMERKARAHMSETGVSQALDILDERSRRIVRERWLNVDDTGVGLTLGDLAKEYGVSAERIRQIEAKALVKMREHMSANTSMVC